MTPTPGAGTAISQIAVCVKWVDLRPEIDLLTGSVATDERRFGFSAADQAALELGKQFADQSGAELTLLCAGPPAVEPALRELSAIGVAQVVRVDLPLDAPSDQVGASLAAAMPTGVELIVCGDYSADRGSGSVPGFVAHRLGITQALGLLEVSADTDGGDVDDGQRLQAIRRLDGGRRERLAISTPAVISVEGSVARLRRASLHAILTARSMPVDRRPPVASGIGGAITGASEPLRPRPRALPAPVGARALDRVIALTGALVERTPPRRIEQPPSVAADAILEQLRAWGYLDDA